jgi:hypothetical protein
MAGAATGFLGVMMPRSSCSPRLPLPTAEYPPKALPLACCLPCGSRHFLQTAHTIDEDGRWRRRPGVGAGAGRRPGGAQRRRLAV